MQYHTPLNECTSNCRREGCPETAEMSDAEKDYETEAMKKAEIK